MKNNTPKIFQAWIDRAEDDLAFAKAGFTEKFYNQVCMLSQQVVEKYLKAYLIKMKGKIDKREKIHDLPKLANWCKELGLDLSDYYVQLRTLSEFYIPARYPDAVFSDFSKDDAMESLKMAEEIIEKINEVMDDGK